LFTQTLGTVRQSNHDNGSCNEELKRVRKPDCGLTSLKYLLQSVLLKKETDSQSILNKKLFTLNLLHERTHTRTRSTCSLYDGHTFVKLLLSHYGHGSRETILRQETSIQQKHDNTTHPLATANVILQQ
jgi:hypothetical protein